MNTVNSWDEIPDFPNEEAEARFWTSHELSPALLKASEHIPDSRESTTITLRFDPRMLSRIKRIARSRFLNYQSMMKQWLAERLEEELRKGEP